MKVVKRYNFRVEVTPRSYLYGFRQTEEHFKEICESMVDEIQRHVNDVDYVETVWDESEHCSFCGYDWDEVEEENSSDGWPKGMPLCCEEAQLDWVWNNLDVKLPEELKYLKKKLEAKEE